MHRILAVLFVLMSGGHGYSQVTSDAGGFAKIVARGADVQVVRGDSESAPSAAGELAEGDSIRTGPASFAVVATNNGVRVTLGPNSNVSLTSLSALPVITLDQGTARVRTEGWTVRIKSSVGDFILSETPGEAEFELLEEKVAVRVFEGGITTEQVETDAVIFRGSDQRPARIYRAGTTQRYFPATPLYPVLPRVYVADPGAAFPYAFPAPSQQTPNEP